MPRRRLDLERSEGRHLAPYAQSSAATRGRVHPEDQHRFRLDFQRDRDRIVHSRSFRRLEYKTQVFLNGTGDHYRTRMTHTMEVSCIARTATRALGLNEDLAEAIALAHDLGHPPFGHLGEETLHRLMAKHGGFRHNAQSIRVVAGGGKARALPGTREGALPPPPPPKARPLEPVRFDEEGRAEEMSQQHFSPPLFIKHKRVLRAMP